MAELQVSASKQALLFVSGKLGYVRTVRTVAIGAIAAAIVVERWTETIEPPGEALGKIAVATFITCIAFLTTGRRWTIVIDPATRRLTIFKLFILRWPMIALRTTVVEDCSFDECDEIGTIEEGSDGGAPYSVYVHFKRGGTRVIPAQGGSLGEAKTKATELAIATGIPMRDAVMAES